VFGDDERAQGKVGLKDMTTGEQRAVNPDEVVTLVRGK
jgi:histidyl-tRNA synthetase